MSSFTQPLDVRQLTGGLWETLRPFDFYWDRPDGRVIYTVPEKFKTNFASIPRIFWPLIGHPAGEYAQAATLHDFLYATALVPRTEADRIFLAAMRALKVARWRRRLMWVAVRGFGWSAYGREKNI